MIQVILFITSQMKIFSKRITLRTLMDFSWLITTYPVRLLKTNFLGCKIKIKRWILMSHFLRSWQLQQKLESFMSLMSSIRFLEIHNLKIWFLRISKIISVRIKSTMTNNNFIKIKKDLKNICNKRNFMETIPIILLIFRI